IQGPQAVSIIQKLTDSDLSAFKHRDCGTIKIAGYQVFASRSGYTGEDGFELFFDRQHAESLWNALIENGAFPCGLGARDSLRLEAGLPLYGHELDETITPLEAIKLAGFEVLDKAIARQGCKLFKDGNEIGYVTSGTFSPTLRKPIFMGYVDTKYGPQYTGISVQIREKLYPVQAVKLPFYRRCDKIN
ncbi:MAG: glycine cleavage T C-terminal barrel domain-containing protein, partial [Candidatus Margulisiibacteriota bacterium]